jgi:hypothetical protein
MASKYTVWTVYEIRTGEVAISGSVAGPLLSIGQRGSAVTSSGCIVVEIVGIGVSDRTLGPPDRQGILVKILKGDPASLKDVTIEFTHP